MESLSGFGGDQFSSIKQKLDSKFEISSSSLSGRSGNSSSSSHSNDKNESFPSRSSSSEFENMNGPPLTNSDATILVKKWINALNSARDSIVKDAESHLDLRMKIRSVENHANYSISKLNVLEAGHDVMKASADRLEERSSYMNELLLSVRKRLKSLSARPELRKYQTDPEFDREKIFKEACELENELERICKEFEDLTERLDGFKLSDLGDDKNFDFGQVINDMGTIKTELKDYEKRFESI